MITGLPPLQGVVNLAPAGVRITYYRNDGRLIALDYGAVTPSDAALRVWSGQIRGTVDDSSPVVGTLDGIANDVDPLHYRVVFTPDDDAIALPDGEYVFDLQYHVGAGRPITVVAGRWVSIGDVTR